MARFVLTLRELGEETSWMLVQQAMGIPDAKMASNYMEDRVALLLFTRPSLPERLCVTASVRQMGGTTIYQGLEDGVWKEEVHAFQAQVMTVFSYYMDCMYVYGFPVTHWRLKENNPGFPVINAGSPESHPAHALADIACMLRGVKNLKNVVASWIGCPNGTLYSLIEASPWFGYSLKLCIPPQIDLSLMKQRIKELNVPITFVSSPEEAVRDAMFVYAGRKEDQADSNILDYKISEKLMKKADKDAKLLLCASPIRSIPIDAQVLSSPASRLFRQAEYRLCVHKRILHWVLS